MSTPKLLFCLGQLADRILSTFIREKSVKVFTVCTDSVTCANCYKHCCSFLMWEGSRQTGNILSTAKVLFQSFLRYKWMGHFWLWFLNLMRYIYTSVLNRGWKLNFWKIKWDLHKRWMESMWTDKEKQNNSHQGP